MQSSSTECTTHVPERTLGLVNEKKLFLMQQQLALLLHADHCRRVEQNGVMTYCSDCHCARIRNLLVHLEECRDKDCSVPYCITSKHILRHYRICSDLECQVCSIVRKPNSVQNGVNTVHLNVKHEQPLVNGIDSSNSPVNHKAACSGSSLDTQGVVTLNGDLSRVPLHEVRITDQQRELTMKKFVNDISLSIFSTTNPNAYSDPRMKQFLDYVKQLEKDVYMKSKSAEEYYKTMTLRYHNIFSELKEKRRLRGAQKPNGNSLSTDIVPSSDESGNVKMEEHNSKSNLDDQDRFSEALEIVCKPENQTQSEIKADSVNDESSSAHSSENLNFHDKTVKKGSPSPETKPFDTNQVGVVESDNLELNSKTPLKAEDSESTEKSSDEKVTETQSEQNPGEPIKRRVWSSNELLQSFLPILIKLSKEKDAEPFLQPVDWKLLEIYDYPKIVTEPMDFSTIRKKLEDRDYTDPWQVVDDVWLMLNNAWLYNKKTSKVYKTCTRLAETFELLIDPVMRCLGFCCGRECYYQPPTLTCLTPKFCTIYRDAIYYVYKSDGQIPGLLDQKYTVCERCYNENGEEITLDSDSRTPVTVPKHLMEKCKNDVKDKEPFVFCKHCGRKWHKICAIYMEEIWPEGFICEHCVKTYCLKRPENRFTARKLMACKLSNFLEKRVNDFLKKKEINTGDVIIRVLAAADKVVEVKSGMKAHYCDNGEMPESFPYRVKAIFAFQEIDGQEVCFFGLHVQEYASDCPMPNTRRVYLAYLDSVYFFRPKQFRTEIYHELLVGYIHYAKLLGFTTAHIWACPPSEGDDYIFHMHPPDQRIPKPKRLQEWYQKMLKKALMERIVVDYKDICQDTNESHMVSPAEMAYFEGDFWPNTLEEIFKEMGEEDAKRKREQEALARGDDDDDTKESVQTRDNDDNPGKKKAKRRKLKRTASLGLAGKRRRGGSGGSSDTIAEVARRVYEIIEKHKENFFVIHLHPPNALLPPIKDPDPLINSELMECRGAFLERAREKHLEFSSLRRAKFSTMAMIYDLHNENRQPLVYTCNMCGVQLETPWHCKQCTEYDLCPRCYETKGHCHPMVKIGLGLDDCNKGQETDNDADVQESGRDKLSRFVKTLGHSCSCRDANCRVFACKTMKQQLQHFRVHANSGRNQCHICRFLSCLCLYHSKTCHEINCPVPLCHTLKAKMKQQQKQQRLKQTQMLRRRMATMQRCNSMTPNHQPTPPPPSQTHQSCLQSFDYISSPMSTSMQSSPFSANSTTTVPISMTSPMSRTQASSIQSPQQNSYCYSSNSHPKSLGHSPSIAQSPSVPFSISGGSQALSNCTSPYSQFVTAEGDLADNSVKSVVYASQPQVHYPYTQGLGPYSNVQQQQQQQQQQRLFSQDRVQPNSISTYSLPNMNVAQHHLTYSSSNAHSSIIRRSPGNAVSAHLASTDLSPTKSLKRTFSSQPMEPMDAPNYSHQAMPNQRFHLETQQSNYVYSKQPSMQNQRHPSQSLDGSSGGSGINYSNMQQQQQQFMPATNWRPSASMNYTYTVAGPSVCSTNQGIPSNSAAVAVTNNNVYSAGAAVNKPTNAQSHPSPNPNSFPSNISPDDIRTVQQAYATVRQRGGQASDFSNWLHSNPQYIRVWQYIQQSSNSTNPPHGMQSLNANLPSSNSYVTMTPPHPTTPSYSMYQAVQPANSSSFVRSNQAQCRYSYPQSTMSNPSHPSWPSQQPQQQQQTYFRSSVPNSTNFNPPTINHQFPPGLGQAPSQFNKPIGCSNSNVIQTPGSVPAQHYQKQTIPTANETFHSSGNHNTMSRCPPPTAMISQHPRINPNQNFCGSTNNRPCVMTPPTGMPGGMMNPRPAQTSHYSSSVMLSQLLGPNQSNAVNPNSSTMYEYSASAKVQHPMIRSIPPNPNMLPVAPAPGPHYTPDANNI